MFAENGGPLKRTRNALKALSFPTHAVVFLNESNSEGLLLPPAADCYPEQLSMRRMGDKRSREGQDVHDAWHSLGQDGTRGKMKTRAGQRRDPKPYAHLVWQGEGPPLVFGKDGTKRAADVSHRSRRSISRPTNVTTRNWHLQQYLVECDDCRHSLRRTAEERTAKQ